MLITFLLPSGKNKFRLNWSWGEKKIIMLGVRQQVDNSESTLLKILGR